ncbi:MAG: nicotinate-nucleotide pyrophosphorylase [Methanomethylovorans sp.]|jgi:nicotinate-nucleotide pyrophosphorylase (carboxylating)/molybdenum transport protein|nr:nicotinate-nucleotide pyrophosphorylase [Methanomethylovorans sp.]
MDLFDLYLEEDCPYEDETTELLGIKGNGRLRIMSREHGVAACMEELAVFYRKKGLEITSHVRDGNEFNPHDVIFEARGDLRQLFKLWRISQTFLSIVCSIAATTRLYVETARKVNKDVIIATSRKTHPGMRKFELKAVRAGGGDHHRNSLSDSILITQNHLGIVEDLNSIKAVRRIEIEPRNEEEALKYAKIADLMLLDHLSAENLQRIIPVLREKNPSIRIAVGGISVQDIPSYAALVDIIVISAPYYAPPLDLTARISRT